MIDLEGEGTPGARPLVEQTLFNWNDIRSPKALDLFSFSGLFQHQKSLFSIKTLNVTILILNGRH